MRTLSADGGSLQTLQTGNERPQHPRKIALDTNGAVLITGYDDVYVETNYVESWEDPFVIRLIPGSDGTGSRDLSVAWWYQYQTVAADFLLGMAIDATGDVFVGGMHGSLWDTGAVVTQLHSDGMAGWTRGISPMFEDMVYSVVVSRTGDLYIAGATFLKLGTQSFGQQDVFVAKLHKETGELLWITQAGWGTSELPTALTLDAEGNIYVAGATWDGADADLFAMKLSPSGDLLNTWQRGTPQNDQIWGAAVDACGRMFLVGYTEGDLIPGAPAAGGRDGFVLKVDL